MDGICFASFAIGILVAVSALNYAMQKSINFRFLMWDAASIAVVLTLLSILISAIIGG